MRKHYLLPALLLALCPPQGFAATINNLSFGASGWRYVVGNAEASSPTSAWRANGYNDAGWLTGTTPLGYGELDIVTPVPDARTQATPSYLCVFTRRTFSVANPTNISDLLLTVRVDDGYVAWINGVEVLRDNMPGGEPLFTSAAPNAIEPTTTSTTISAGLTTLLVPGVNVLAIQYFNANTNSSDLLLDASIVSTIDDVAPTIINRIPSPGQTVQTLNFIEIVFSEPVQGVEASDLLLNGVPATNILFGVPGQFVFQFPAPPTGSVVITFTNNHGITDLANPPNAFVAVSWTYVLDPNSNPGTFRITEFLTSNDRGIRDENGDTSDWIELYNPSATANLQGWALTDDPLNLSKWKFPYTILDANNYLHVFASGKDRTNVTGNLKMHTSFGLVTGGGYLALVDPATNVVSVFNPYPAQSTDISYGRDLANPNLVGYYSTPSPGNPNVSIGDGIAPAVTFSHSSRTFVSGSPFTLTLSTPGVANGAIYYALGTNLPGSNTILYTAPINVTTTTVIRARSFVAGKLPGSVQTKSYIALSAANAGVLPGATNVVTVNSAIPIIILHNYGQGTVPANSDVEQHVLFQVFDNDCGRASMTNLPNLTGRGVFHARGSSTLTASSGKAQFLLEARDEIAGDLDVSMLGLPAESDWVLYAPNQFEPGLIHNPLAHAWYRDLGRYGSRTRFFELYLQDDSNPGGSIIPSDYHGIYVLEEKIKRNKNRVDIERLDAEDTVGADLTGGYLLSIDRADTGKAPLGGLNFATPSPINFLDPSASDMTNVLRAPQITYIRNYLNNFNTTLNNNALWTNPITGYPAYIDVPSWIDLHIHEVITFNVDAMRLSGYFYKDRDKKMEYGPTWDYDRTQGSTDGRDANPRTWRSQAGDLGTDFFNFTPWWNRLLLAPDFWQAWIDRYQELREGTNVLSTNNIFGHITRLASEVTEAHPRELARWNRQPRGAGGSGTGTFATETQWKRNWYSNRLDFADGQFLAKPALSVTPGPLAGTITVTVTPIVGLGNKPGGTELYVSLDGTDPRLSGGGIATGPNILTAINNNSINVTITNNVRLFARCRNGSHANLTGANNPPAVSRWSGPTAGTYYFTNQTPPLRVTEIMYNPAKAPPGDATNDASNFEYLEFKNISASPLNITGYRLRGGVEFDFPSLTLPAGGLCVVVADLTAFQSRYGMSPLVAGSYTNKPSQNRLGNDGDHIKLEGAVREPILDFEYKDSWYPSTDGPGFALQIVDENLPTTAWGLKSSWQPTESVLGTPGTTNLGSVAQAQIVINEILTHTDLPQVDAIELYNSTGVPVNLGGWFLTDNFGSPKKYRIAGGTTIPANGYLALYSDTSFGSAFDLSSRGEEVYLFSGDSNTNLTGYVHGFDFGAQANGVTFGRYLTSTGVQYPAQSSPTLGATNASPKVGPIVISEILYHPPEIGTVEGPRDNDKDAFVELENITGMAQPLYDPMAPANTWRIRDGINFTFPTDVVIPAGGRVLLVSFDPIADPYATLTFRSRNGAFPGTPIFGPYSGQLDNSGESVELVRPDVPQPPTAPDAGAVYYILVDKVNYSDSPPWPIGADGGGYSLQRVASGGYGNDPANWAADLSSPGFSSSAGTGPFFTQQPQNVTVLGTLTAFISVTATGAPPIFYQWYFNNVALPGATNSLLALENVTVGQSGLYRCLALNPGGATFSSNATLTVLTPASITQQPAMVLLRVPPDTGTAANRTAIFTVTATTTNAPLSYQWRVNGTNIPLNTTNIFGMTTNRLTITNVMFGHAGYYSCAITDGNGTVFSADALLGVLPFLVVSPQPVTVAEGADISMSTVVQAFPPPFLYSWRRTTPVNTNIVSTDMTNFATWNSTVAGYVLTNNMLSSNFALRLIFTNRATSATGLQMLNNNAFITIMADTDQDGIPNLVETALGLDPMIAADALGDLDGDGMSNVNEYRSGTDPADPVSVLKVDLTNIPGQATVRFGAVSNRTYTVQYADQLPAPIWFKLADVVTSTTNRTELFADPTWTTNRFYRAVTPQIP